MKRKSGVLVIVGLLLALLVPIAGARIEQADLPGLGDLAGLSQPDPPQPDAVPQMVSYQGRVTVSGVPHNGTGYFKFAVVNAAGTNSFWSNDDTSVGGGEPAANVPLSVSAGLFNVLLGDTTLPGMTQALTPGVFGASNRYLRVWFATAAGGPYTLLAPDRRITSAPYALNAETLDGQNSTDFALASHDHFGQTWTGSITTGLTLNNSGATGLYASGSTYGVYGYASTSGAWDYGVYGVGEDYGVRGVSQPLVGGGIGVYGSVSGTFGENYAVYGSASNASVTDYGVVGTSDDTGVYADGDEYGVYGSGSDTGVYGAAVNTGVYGSAASYGVYGSALWTGVYASASNTLNGTRYGVYSSASGGPLGFDYAVYGTSDDIGIYGNATDTSTGTNYGVYGAASNSGVQDYGVFGTSDDTGVYGSGDLYGVYGSVVDASGTNYAVRANASNTGATDYAVYGTSDNTGLYGSTTNALFDWGMYTPDDIFVGGACSGCLLDFAARNGGGDALEPGDLVAILGVEAPLPDSRQPVMVVRKARTGDTVVGVVYHAALLRDVPVSDPLDPEGTDERVEQALGYAEGAAAPGDLLVVATHGPLYVKVSGTVAAGDLLVAGDEPGTAQAVHPASLEEMMGILGRVLGRALGPPDAATGLAPVLVTLQ